MSLESAAIVGPPLEHERATVYDRFFDVIETEEIDGQREFEGEGFMEFLARLVG
jgi:hypothetical protein